ncbi:MAG TPA: YebC/PmpR family DNA-binding transcriptional regulator [Fastidiosipila sp.]|nr:YebC/PmpR family DNA-binding transcriptional regulator [Fastidiosipila sp.]
MAGHSKWNNIKRRKGAVDAERAQIFTKLGREIHLAVRHGGPDPETNRALRDAIARAKASNMPNDNISRSIAKASGAADGDNFEEVLYEGYGPGGVAVMVRTLTDNRNRTAGDIRHFFDKFGGNLGTKGSVSYQFETKGSLILDKELFDDEEAVMLSALEAGADDVVADDEMIEILTTPDDYETVREHLETEGFRFADASVGPVAMTTVRLDDVAMQEQMEKLRDALNGHDDVQDIFDNWDESE